MSDARKRAEEALASALVTLSNEPRYADLFDEVSNLREASATKAALRHAARELQYVLDSNPCDQYDIHQTVEGKACVALAEGLLGPMQDWPDEENASAILSALAAFDAAAGEKGGE